MSDTKRVCPDGECGKYPFCPCGTSTETIVGDLFVHLADNPTSTQPVEPFLAEHKRRPTAKQDGIAAWLRDEIAYLEAGDRTEYGDGLLAAHKATLRELER